MNPNRKEPKRRIPTVEEMIDADPRLRIEIAKHAVSVEVDELEREIDEWADDWRRRHRD